MPVTRRSAAKAAAEEADPKVESDTMTEVTEEEETQKFGAGTDPAAKEKDLLANQEFSKKMASIKVRTISTIWLLGGFFMTIYLGHFYLWCLVMGIQLVMVHELFLLAAEERSENELPGFRFLQWFFTASSIFFVHGGFVKNNLFFAVTQTTLWPPAVKFFSLLLRRHSLLSYLLYCTGLVIFVGTLKKGLYMYQFSQFAWTHMILLVVVTQSSFFVSNIFEGIIWFVLPVSIVIINDIMAYISGMCFGRTPLISLSPKKTVEGFVGGLLFTMVASFFIARPLGSFKWTTCPRTNFGVRGWAGTLDCPDDPTFTVQTFKVEELLDEIAFITPTSMLEVIGWATHMLGLHEITCMPIQLHAVVLAAFASLIAPFGGFFASGFKRAFKIKDFGDSIPGHGGLTDRMDCQLIMAAFSYVYYQTVVKASANTYASVLNDVQDLTRSEQLDLYNTLQSMLTADGILPQE